MTRPMEARLARLEAKTDQTTTEATVPPALRDALDRVAALKAAGTLGPDAGIADLWQAATGAGMAEALGIGPMPASPLPEGDAP